MKTYNKIKSVYELQEYSGFLTSEFENKKRFIITENGFDLYGNHFSLTEATNILKQLN
jgi:hypothetical protein